MFGSKSIRTKLLLLISIPVAMLLYFAVSTTATAIKDYQKLNSVKELTHLSTRFGDLAHELQKERGMSSGFIGSKGEKFRVELTEQRKKSDKALLALKQTISKRLLSRHGAALADAVSDSMRRLDRILQHRENVSNLAIDATENITYYNETIASLLKVPATLPLISGNQEVSTLGLAYSSLLHAKEYAGIERATLSNTFARDNFAPGFYIRFITIVANQDTYLFLFNIYANEDQKKFYETKLNFPAVTEMMKLRYFAMQNGNSTTLGNVEPTLWFDLSTKRINAMKEVENKLADGLIERTETILAETRTSAVLLCWLTLCAIAASAIIIIFISRKIIDPILACMTLAKQLTLADPSLKEALESSDETQFLLNALQYMLAGMQSNPEDENN